MTSQLHLNFQASDDLSTPNFKCQVNTMNIWGLQVATLIYYNMQEGPTYHY